MTGLRTCVAVIGVASCASHPPRGGSVEGPRVGTALATAAPSSRGDLVAMLRRDLSEVRSKRGGDDPVEKWGPTELKYLVGMTAADIKHELGAPDCTATAEVPCLGDADLAYEFFYLPPTWLGGGPNLLIWIDARSSACDEARWLGTK
jgi:hypothetical protein